MKSVWQIAEEIRMRAKNTVNVAMTSVDDAYAYARKALGVNGINIDDDMPNFRKNYKILRDNINKHEKGINRFDMPAIKGSETAKFKRDIKEMEKYGNVDSKIKQMPVGKLKPIQDQVWLDFMMDNFIRFGFPYKGATITKKIMITSKDGFIIDGHHRYAQVLLTDPKLKMSVLVVDLKIDDLLELARRYAADIGNTGNQ